MSIIQELYAIFDNEYARHIARRSSKNLLLIELRARAKISSGIRTPLDPTASVTLFGKGTAIACKACLAGVAQ